MVEREQKKPGFFSRPRNVVLLVLGVLGALVAAFVIFVFVDDYRLEQDVLRVEEDMALYIFNEAKLAEGEEIESITFDVIAEKCDNRMVCGSYDHATEVYIKSTQREWIMETRSYPDIYWYYDFEKPDKLCVGEETTDSELCFNHHAKNADKSAWTKTLDDITVHYDSDFPIG